MEISVEAIERAVSQFYQSQSTFHAEANEWLEKAKNSPEAWLFVWELLQPHRASDVQFFAATTLQSKIKKFLHELSSENLSALKEKLVTTIAESSNTNSKNILNRLCISLSIYILQTFPEKWADPVPDILVMFAPENLPHLSSDRTIWVLLEILTVLPEEFSSTNLDQHHKGLLRHHFTQHTPLVMKLIEKVLTTYSSEDIIVQALKGATSWITLGVSFPEYQNLLSIVVNLIFGTHKQHTRICDKAFEFLKGIVELPENFKYPNHLLEFLTRILTLGDILSLELTSGNSADQKLICNIYNLFLSFGGTHTKHCLSWIKQGDSSKEKVLLLISHILQCSGAKGSYPIDETYSRLTFGFWYTLQDELILSADYELYMKYLGPVYSELVNILIVKAQLPQVEQNYTKQDLEAFRCYRQDISDTLMYCHGILHETTFSLIQSKLYKINLNGSKWQELEACLFSLCSVSESVDLEENKFLPPLFEYIRNLPFQRLDPKVLSTALDTIGAYASWMSAHKLSLDHVLPIIILGLNTPETISNATMALKDVTRDCQCDMKPYSSLILDASQRVLHGGRLKFNDSQRLMSTVGLILSNLSLDTILHYLNLILTPYMDQLNSLSFQEPTSSIKTNILFCIRIIGVLSSTLNIRLELNSDLTNQQCQNNEPQPVLLILQKLLPVLKLLASSWSSDEQIMQSIFVLLKQSVTTLLEDVEPIVTDILELIVSSYRVYPQPAALDLSKTLSTLFGKIDKFQPMLQTLTNELCSVAMSKLSAASALSDHTDLLEALFSYLTQIVKKTPKLIFCTDCTLIFQCATITLTVPELPTVKSAAAFLVIFINQSAEHENQRTVVNAHGEKLVQQMVQCIAGESSRSNIEPLAAIFLALNRYYCECNSLWLRQAVTENVCPRSSPQQRENFVTTVLRCQRNKEQLQEAIKKFSLICRGIIGTEYAKSISPYY